MNFRGRLLHITIQHPRIVIGLWACLVIGCMVPLIARLTGSAPLIDNSVGVWFLKDDPNLRLYEQNNDAFGRKEWSVLMLETDSVSDPSFLRDLARLTSDLEALPHVRSVLSLANVHGLATLPGMPSHMAMLLDPSATHPDRALRAGLSKMPAVERLLLPQGWGRRTVLLVQSDNFLHDLDPYRMALVDSVHRLAEGYATIGRHSLAGTTVINAELNRSARRDALRFYVLVTAMVVLFGWLALRDVGDLVIVSSVLVVSVVGPMGAIAAWGIPFNMITILLPLILVSLSVCDVVHVINAFHGERLGLSAKKAASAAIRRLWTPCLWTSIVTVVGILSLGFSSVAPIRQMGLFTSLGLVLAWACTMTLVPSLLALFWKNRSRSSKSGWEPQKYGARLLPFLSGRWRWVWLVVAVALTLPIVGLNRLRVDTDYAHFFAPSAPVSRAYKELQDAGVSQSVVEIVVTASPGSTLDDRQGRNALWLLESGVRRLPHVRNTLSEGALMDKIDQGLNGPSQQARWLSYPVPVALGIREKAHGLGFSELDDYATADRNRQRIIVLTDYMSSTELARFRGSVEQIALQVLPRAADATLEGTTVLWSNMDREISNTQVRSILVLTIVFVILLPILFRSVSLGLLGILINGLPLAMTFGLMGLLGIRLNMATALIGGVSMGSTVDSTLFFINRFQAERAAGKLWNEAIGAAVLGVGDGILITTAILVGGFLCMTVSSFSPTAQFGLFTCFTILAGAYLDIVVDPIILGLLSPRSERQVFHATSCLEV